MEKTRRKRDVTGLKFNLKRGLEVVKTFLGEDAFQTVTKPKTPTEQETNE
jgi:hypothetical protein